METASENYAEVVRIAAGISSNEVLTVSMVARAADAQGVDMAMWFPALSRV